MTKISVAGDSAGGNLAVGGVALLARDRQSQIFDKMLLFIQSLTIDKSHHL